MNRLPSFLFLFVACAFVGWGQVNDYSFLSQTSPANCGTADNAVVTLAQLAGSGSGFGCLRTLIFPQFAVGNGWTTQITGFLPTQSPAAGLVTGNVPSFLVDIRAGDGATATPNNGPAVLMSSVASGCLGFWESISGQALKHADAEIGPGDAGRANYTGIATRGKCTGGADMQMAGGAQGPMQLQVVAPNATALSQATGQLSYFYDGGTFQWQVTVNPIDINGAKPRWTAPLYQGGEYVTAFSVVNASSTAQTVTVSLRDDNGNPIGSPKSTPLLAAGCGCNQWGVSATGGFYAITVGDFFGNIGTQTGSIEFDGSAGNILVIVLRTIKNSLGAVPAR